MTAQQAALYPACVRFVAEQSEGEWSDETIYADAKKLAIIMDEVRLQARADALEEAAVRCDEIAEIACRAKNIGMQAGSMASASEIRKLALPRGHNGGPALRNLTSNTEGKGA